jgi:hypothetical protein
MTLAAEPRLEALKARFPHMIGIEVDRNDRRAIS